MSASWTSFSKIATCHTAIISLIEDAKEIRFDETEEGNNLFAQVVDLFTDVSNLQPENFQADKIVLWATDLQEKYIDGMMTHIQNRLNVHMRMIFSSTARDRSLSSLKFAAETYDDVFDRLRNYPTIQQQISQYDRAYYFQINFKSDIADQIRKIAGIEFASNPRALDPKIQARFARDNYEVELGNMAHMISGMIEHPRFCNIGYRLASVLLSAEKFRENFPGHPHDSFVACSANFRVVVEEIEEAYQDLTNFENFRRKIVAEIFA